MKAHQRDLEIIYEDECVRISFDPGNISGEAVISFTGIGLKLGGIQQREFDSTLSGQRDVYYVTDFKRSWFNDCEEAIVDVLQQTLLERSTHSVMTLGNSMGGSGAVAFAGRIPGCKTAIAFAPQSSIHPSVAPFEKRYLDYASRVRDWRLPDICALFDSSISYQLFFGDREPIDLLHAKRFRQANPSGCQIHMIQGADHNVARFLKQSGISLGRLISEAARGEHRAAKYLESKSIVYMSEPVSKTNITSAMKFSHRMTETGENNHIRNQLELQVFGLQRSGNHGVIGWITQQFDAPAYFFNNVTHFEDPVTHWHAGSVPNTVQLPPKGHENLENIRNHKKDVLIYSYENLRLKELADRSLVENHDTCLGRSLETKRILLLRDFFNWVSSRLKLFDYRGQTTSDQEKRMDGLINSWLMYAREFDGQSNFLGTTNVVRVSYPKWVIDPEYRAWILGAASIPLRNNTNDHVPDVGGGSSFDTTQYSGRAGEMAVQQRWSFFLEDDRFGPARERVKARQHQIEPLNQDIFQASWML